MTKELVLMKTKYICSLLCWFLLLGFLTSCHIQESSKENGSENPSIQTNNVEEEDQQMKHIQMSIQNHAFTVNLYDNDSTRALIKLLPMTQDFHEMNGNEKYHYLSTALPTNAEAVRQIHAGDIMLFGSDCLVVFYESFATTYSYTRIGYVENIEGLKEVLGEGNAKLTFEIE